MMGLLLALTACRADRPMGPVAAQVQASTDDGASLSTAELYDNHGTLKLSARGEFGRARYCGDRFIARKQRSSAPTEGWIAERGE